MIHPTLRSAALIALLIASACGNFGLSSQSPDADGVADADGDGDSDADGDSDSDSDADGDSDSDSDSDSDADTDGDADAAADTDAETEADADSDDPCGSTDSDGDGVGDLCDRCEGGDDDVDEDTNGTPDDCDPRLVHHYHIAHGGDLAVSDATGVTVEFGYTVAPVPCGRVYVGTADPLMDGDLGTTDFGAATPSFSDFAACYEGWVPPGVTMASCIHLFPTGNAVCSADPTWDLSFSGYHLSFVRRTINELTVTDEDASWSLWLDVDWEVWGTLGIPR